MAKQTINIGTTANDGTGDPLRSAFDKSNDNFTELYAKPDLSLAANILTLTKADGTTDTVDLSPYLDEDARAIASGTINGSGIVTFTRDDATTFTLDLSSLLDDTNLVTSVNTQVGAVVLDSDDIAEGSTNEYYTEAKVSANTSVVANTAKVTNATHTGDVTGETTLTIAANEVTNAKIADNAVDTDQIADGAIDEVHLNATNTPSADQILKWDGSTGFTWIDQFDGDITGIVAGNGLTGDATSGDASLAVGAGTGITVNANDIQISDGGVDTTQLAADAVEGTKIADDSIDSEHYVDASIDTAHFSLTAAINVNVDQNSGTLQLWSGTQAQYDALTPDASTLYFIT